MFAATDYPLLDIFWTMLWFFLFVLWIWIIITIFVDIVRSRDIGGVKKFLWTIFVIFLPYLGAFIYLLVRGGKMHERQVEQANAEERAVTDYVRNVAGTSSTADELAKLSDLRARGVISDADFEVAKAKVLG